MRRLSLPTVLLLGTLSAFLTSCSRSPVAPITTQGGAQSMAGFQTDDPPTDVQGGTSAVATAAILPSEEGRLTVGRFTLDLHKNTLKMPATITMRVANEAAMEVEIDIQPAEANDFQVAADLTASMVDQPNADLQQMTMFEWDGNAWQAISETSPHANQGNLVSKLKHVHNSAVADKNNKAEITTTANTRGR